MTERLVVGTQLYAGFELLDAAGPIELLSHVDGIENWVIGPVNQPVLSAQGVSVYADHDPAEVPALDVLLVPGGPGTRSLVSDEPFLEGLRRLARVSSIVASVCTGSALLAAAGLLDGYRATSNKKAFHWAASTSELVDWAPHARWVQDRDRWTSSGVAAGMDMAHALASHLCGKDAADRSAAFIEYEVHRDAARDPFAELYGL